MPARYQVIALSSIDPDGTDLRDEPKLLYPDALKLAQEFKAQGKAFRVFVEGLYPMDQLQAFRDLGACVDESREGRRGLERHRNDKD